MAMGGVIFGVMLVLVTFSLESVSGAGGEGLVIELQSHTLSLGSATPKLEVVVKSASSGEAVPSATVSLISVHSVASGAPVSLSDNADFVAVGDGRYELGLGELSLGKYKVRVDAATSAGRKGFLASVVCASARMEVSNTNVVLLESDGAAADSHQGVKFGETVAISATQAQKLKVEFEVKSPSGAAFKPQQAILKLRHVESGAEVPYLVSEGSQTVEFSKQRSGAYSVDLIVGDDAMENSFLWSVATLDLDGPEEESPVTPPVSKFAPKPEISHIFRQPEKRPPTYLSMAFLILTLLPLVGFLVGLQQLGVNLKSLPSGGLPLAASAGFHGGIAMILGLYLMFWVKLNLFTTLQILGFLGLFTLVPGFHILSYLADHSAKAKSA